MISFGTYSTPKYASFCLTAVVILKACIMNFHKFILVQVFLQQNCSQQVTATQTLMEAKEALNQHPLAIAESLLTCINKRCYCSFLFQKVQLPAIYI